MRNKALFGSLTALVCALLAQPAFGATAWISIANGEPDINYEAALGEINDVSILEALTAST